jgi:dimethylhistidine N-methyltransferase
MMSGSKPSLARIERVRVATAAAQPDDGQDVAAGLRAVPKTLPPKYFYDDAGARLFERITELPEYYPTRTEHAILAAAAPEIAGLCAPADLVELGSGSARKTRLLIEALLAAAADAPLRYVPIDVSEAALRESIDRLAAAYPRLDLAGVLGNYEDGLRALPPAQAPRRLLAFLGSTIGNLDEDETAAFFAHAAAALAPGDFFLLGFDLVKPAPILHAAYNDAAGVTAAFNLNMLRHLNRRFAGNFDLRRFRHEAFFDSEKRRIEMHLVSECAQTVTLERLNLSIEIAAGETIRSEISRKFRVADMEAALARHRFRPLRRWSDPHNWFAVTLAQRT